jgi:TetR/AcrR family transcriptional regulator
MPREPIKNGSGGRVRSQGRTLTPNRVSSQTSPLERGEILNEAARLFLEHGYERTRMQDIAATFGVTHAALYYYFPRKSDILAELNFSALSALLAGARAAEAESATPAERFQRQLETHVGFVVENLALVACFFHYDKSIEPKQLKKIHQLRREYTEMLTASFAAAQATGGFADAVDAKTAVNTLLGAANWMCQWLVVDQKTKTKALAENVTEMLAGGFRG